jgi:hypothetical protein
VREELWLEIEDFPEYFVSNFGNIYSAKSKKLLQPEFTHNGYLCVRLVNPEGRKYKRRIHRLVAGAWMGDQPEGYEIDHKNDVRYDNRLDNLEWFSRNENLKRKRVRHRVLKSNFTRAHLLKYNTGFSQEHCEELVERYYEEVRRGLVSKLYEKVPDCVLALEIAERAKQQEERFNKKDIPG